MPPPLYGANKTSNKTNRKLKQNTMEKELYGYEATVKFNDEQEEVAGCIFKIGDFDEENATQEEIDEDENVFFYLENESEIESLKQEGAHDFIVLNYEPIYK